MDGPTVFIIVLAGSFSFSLIAVITWFGIRARKNPWLGDNLDKALKSVENETDQAKLESIVRNAQLFPVRVAAADKLIDKSIAQEVFAYIAVNSDNQDDCLAAVKELTDQSRLADVALDSIELNTRESAIGKIYNQSLLAVVADKSQDSSVRLQAKVRLAEQGVTVEDLVINEMNAECGACGGSGWRLDLRDDSHIECYECKGTGVVKVSYYAEAV